MTKSEGYDWSIKVSPEIKELLGTTMPPPRWVESDPNRRQAYYFASYRFVAHLVEARGIYELAFKDRNSDTSEKIR